LDELQDRQPGAWIDVVFPLPEVVVNGVPLRKIMGKCPPPTTLPEDVKNRIEHRMQIHFERAGGFADSFEDRLDFLKLCRADVTGIARRW